MVNFFCSTVFSCGFHQIKNESWREFTRSIHRPQLSHEALSLIFTSHSSKNLRANEHRSCWGAAKCARSVWVEIPSHNTIWWNETLWQKNEDMLWCRHRNDVILFHVCGASFIGNAKDSVIASSASPSSSTTKDAHVCTEKAQKKAASWKSSGEKSLLIKISRQTSPRNTDGYLRKSIWHHAGYWKKAPGQDIGAMLRAKLRRSWAGNGGHWWVQDGRSSQGFDSAFVVYDTKAPPGVIQY